MTAQFGRGAWGAAYEQLRATDLHAGGTLDELERLAVSAYLIGRDDDSVSAWNRACQGYQENGDLARAARCAFWLGWGLFYKGQMAHSAGWFARAQRLVDEFGRDCAERGLLLVPVACSQLFGDNDAERGFDTFSAVGTIGERFGDDDLIAFGRLGTGQSLIRLGRVAEGMSLLDEAMLSVIGGELSPLVAGTVYCAVILECRANFDLRRAVEWTAALKAWCDSEPDLVPYRGQCLVHRSEVMQLRGDWPDALAEATQAVELLGRPPTQPAVGMAHYQKGEIHRLRGEFGPAHESYREASRHGHEPLPGLALLRLGQGEVEVALAALTRALDQSAASRDRAKVLPAFVEVTLAAGLVTEARRAAEELGSIAVGLDNAPILRAEAAQALGSVLLAEGDHQGASRELHRARSAWHDLEAPYEEARVRVLLALACRELGDTASADLEFDAALWAFDRLGAAFDGSRVGGLSGAPKGRPGKGGLTAREIEVLTHVVAGRTNREIATALVVSEHTVRRHLQNIFAKIDVASRAAATAYALQNHLV